MRLDVALNKIGVQIVRQHSPDKKSATLMMRVPASSLGIWAKVVEEFLLSAETVPTAELKWSADVSRVYFVDKESRSVRYLWRVVLSGNCAGAAETLGMAIIRSLSGTVEVTSQPLVGRVEYQGTMGAHPTGAAQVVLAKHFVPGADG